MYLPSTELLSALLSHATYADGLRTKMAGEQLFQSLSPSATPVLARLIADNFSVAAHLESNETPFFASGFDATVWRGLPGSPFSGKLYLSIQGTLGAADWLADAQLTLTGNAGQQIIDMVNWWRKITTPKDADVVQNEYLYDADKGFSTWQKSLVAGEGLISADELDRGVEVAGHSLGGYLATAFTRLLGKQANVLHTSTFNSAGFTSSSEAVFAQLQNQFGPSLGIGRFPNQSEQTNYFAKNGLSVTTANSFWFNQVGQRVDVYNEEGLSPANHSMYKLTDSLGLFAVMSKLEPGLTMARFNELVAAASNVPGGSLEAAADALWHSVIDRSAPKLAIGDADNSPPERVAYETALQDLQQNAAFAQLAGKTTFASIGTNLGLQAKSRVDFQTMAALQALTTFILNPAGASGVAALQDRWRAFSGGDYDAWLADVAALNAGREAENFTDEYLADRSLLLQTILKRNTEDISGSVVGGSSVGTDRIVNFRYHEPGTVADSTVTLWNPAANGAGDGLARPPQLIAFGTEGSDVVDGTAETKFGDRLYGGSGNDVINALDGDDCLDGGAGNDVLNGGAGIDTLRGGGGSDTLVGGEGNDRLVGGTGSDSYVFDGASGVDIVRDADGLGSIVVNGRVLTGGKKAAENTWLSEDGQVAYVVAEGNLVIRQGAVIGGRGVVTVQSWKPGDLGIVLSDEAVAPPQPSNLYDGDFAKKANEDGTRYVLGADGQYVAAGDQPGAADLLTGTTASDRIQGFGGDDALLAMAGNDIVEGGDGNDILMGGLGGDTLIGGAGRDLIFGSSTGALQYPTDTAYRLNESSYPVLLAEGFNWRLSSPGPDADGYQHAYLSSTVARDSQPYDDGNVIDAGPGNDTVYAGTGNDVVHAGADNDQVMGLAGDDVLFGDDGDDRMYGDGPTATSESIVYTSAGEHGNDLLIGGAGNDLLFGQGGSDALYGGEGGDVLYGDDREDASLTGDDFLDGGVGDDTLYGGSGSDILVGGAGDDTLRGGAGRDIYVYNRGDGSDIVEDDGRDSVLRLGPGLTPDDVRLGIGSLRIGFGGRDEVHFAGFDPLDARGTAPLAGIEFADGSTISAGGLLDRGFDLDGTSADDQLHGTSVDDRMRGYDGNDLLFGLAGNDTLFGGTGSDELSGGTGDDILVGGPGDDLLVAGGIGTKTYRFDAGDGNDVVTFSSGTRHVEFGAGISRSDIRMFVNPADTASTYVRVQYGASDSVLIQLGSGAGVLDYRFADGSVVSHASLAASATQSDRASYAVLGTSDNDNVYTPGPAALIDAGAGDDTIDGADGNDTLRGGSGNDLLRGRDGDDVLQGGPGNDRLFGGRGSDVYLYGRGDGSDVIGEEAGGIDVLRLTDLNPADVRYTREASGSLVVHVSNSSDTIEISGWCAANPTRVQRIEFADGTVVVGSAFDNLAPSRILANGSGVPLTGTDFADTIVGTSSADVIDGRAGDDSIAGGGGNDTYTLRWGMGLDTIVETGHDSDVLQLSAGLDAGDLGFRRDGNNLSVQLADSTSGVILTDYYVGFDAGWILRAADGTQQPLAQAMQVAVNTQPPVTLDELRSRWLADGARHFARVLSDPQFGAGPNDTVSIRVETQVDDSIDMNRASPRESGGSVDQWTTLQVPDYRYNVQDAGQGKLIITDLRALNADGQPIDYAYDPAVGFRFDWVGTFDTRPAITATRTVTVRVPYAANAYVVNDERITGGASSNRIGTEGFGSVDGGAGDDVIWARTAVGGEHEPGQFLYGGSGNDFIESGYGKDLVIGGDGDDYLAGSFGGDTYYLFADQGGTKILDEAAMYWTVPGLFHFDTPTIVYANTGYQDEDGFYRADHPRADDVVEFGAGITLDQLQMRRGAYTSPYAYDFRWPDPADQQFETLDFTWGAGKAARVLLRQPFRRAFEDDGTGIELFKFADGRTYTIDEMAALVDARNAHTLALWRGDGARTLALGEDTQSVTFGPGIASSEVAVARDGSDLVLGVTGTADQWRLPGWFDNAARLTSFTAAFTDGTTWSGAQLAPQNREPIPGAALSDQSPLEDQAWSFQLPADTFQDPDAGDTLVYAASGATGGALPGWLTFDSASRTFSGTPANADVGEFSVAVSATDHAGASASTQFVVRVTNVNDAPVVQAAASNQQAAETRPFAIQLPQDLFTDEDAGDALAWTVTQANGAAPPGWLTFDPQLRLLQGTPALGAGGTLSLSVIATDNAGASAGQSFDLAIGYAPRAGAPLAAQQATEDSPWTFALPDGAFTDADSGDVLTYAATSLDGSPLPPWLSFDPAMRLFSGTPLNEDVGSAEISVTATDTSGASAETRLRIEVLNVNDAPVAALAIPDQQATEDVPWLYTIEPGTFVDVDATDRLLYSARLASGELLPSWLQFDPLTHSFSGTPANDDVGAVALAVTAADLAGASAHASFAVNVTNVNDAPIAAATLTPWSVVAGDPFSYVIPQHAFTDVDRGDRLSLAATSAGGTPLPAWLVFDPAARTLSGTAAPSDAGAMTLTVTATDLAGARASQGLAVEIKPGLTLSGAAGADTLTGRAGNDVLDGGSGADRMAGGKGDDTYFVSEAGDVVIELAGEGIDGVHSAVSYSLPANVEQLFLDGSSRAGLPPLPSLPGTAMVPGLSGTGNALDNLLVGNAENNVLSAGAGNDTLDGRGGNDRLIGGTGNDLFLVGRGSGNDTIEENDATRGNVDTVQFGAGIGFSQLWLRKHGNDLEVSVVGTEDSVSIANWYKGSQYHVEQFKTADGKVLLDSQVQRLVDAMAAFSPPAAGQTSLPAAYQQQLAPVLAASWQ